MTLTRREKYMIVIGLIIVSLAAYIVYFLIPYMQNSDSARQRQASARSQLSILNAQAGSINTMEDSIAMLKKDLKERGAAIATGLDHAKVLLYLEKLTNGRAVDVSILAAPDQPMQSKFLTQAVTMEFRTSWPVFVQIMEDLKKNELYNQVAYLKTEYREVDAPPAIVPGATGETPAPTPVPADKNVIAVHLELVFYAFEPAEGELPEPPLPPSVSDRKDNLFPLK